MVIQTFLIYTDLFVSVNAEQFPYRKCEYSLVSLERYFQKVKCHKTNSTNVFNTENLYNITFIS